MKKVGDIQQYKPPTGALAKESRDDQQYKATLASIVTLMVDGAVFKKTPKDAVPVIQAWYSALRHKVPLDMLQPTFEELVARGGWFPDAATFNDVAQSLMRAREWDTQREAFREQDRLGRERVREQLRRGGRDPDEPATPEFREHIQSRMSPGAAALLRGMVVEQDTEAA